MYDSFAEGRRAAEQQLEHSRTQSANAPNRNSEWRQIRERAPPIEAFLSTSAPAGDPNSLLRANETLRQPACRDEIIVVPRTPPKAGPLRRHHQRQRHHQLHLRGCRIAQSPRCLVRGLSLLFSISMGDGVGIGRTVGCGGRIMIITSQMCIAQFITHPMMRSGHGWKTAGTTIQCAMASSTCEHNSRAHYLVMPQRAQSA